MRSGEVPRKTLEKELPKGPPNCHRIPLTAPPAPGPHFPYRICDLTPPFRTLTPRPPVGVTLKEDPGPHGLSGNLRSHEPGEAL